MFTCNLCLSKFCNYEYLNGEEKVQTYNLLKKVKLNFKFAIIDEKNPDILGKLREEI